MPLNSPKSPRRREHPIGVRLPQQDYDELNRLAAERRATGRTKPGGYGPASVAREVLAAWAAEQRRTRSVA
jgi:hypothetical protein